MRKEAAPAVAGTGHGALERRQLADRTRQRLRGKWMESSARRSADGNSRRRAADHFHIFVEEQRALGRTRLSADGRVSIGAPSGQAALKSPRPRGPRSQKPPESKSLGCLGLAKSRDFCLTTLPDCAPREQIRSPIVVETRPRWVDGGSSTK